MSTSMIIWIVVACLLIITLAVRIAGEHRGHYMRIEKGAAQKTKTKP